MGKMWNNEKGGKLNLDLVEKSALLHDISRVESNHEGVGAKLLAEKGYPEVANIVGNHMTLSKEYQGRINETSLVYLADKMVKEDMLVTIDKRYSFGINHFTKEGRVDIVESIKERRQVARDLYQIIQPKTNALIVAAGLSSRMGAFKPLLKLGDTTMIGRIIATFKVAGVEEIVVITGNNKAQLEEHIKPMGVTTIYNKDYATTDMFHSAKLGLEYLKDKGDRVIFNPVDIPMFSVDTVKVLIESCEKLASPAYKGKKGHPLMFSNSHIETILKYEGNMGMKGGIESLGETTQLIETFDKGVLKDADTPEEFESIVKML